VSTKRGAIRRKRSPGDPPLPTTAEVFHAHASFVWRVLRRLGVSDADVEDACQEVFVVAHRRLDDFEGRASVQTWLYGICVRVGAAHRRRARVREQPASTHHEQAAEAPQEDEVALREARVELDRMLGALDDEKRAVFVLFEIEELPMTEVAEAVGCPLQTAYSRLHAARREIDLMLTRIRARMQAP
jgi:RNA polymerase sigma-70 factor (ECF subfamily)